MSMATNGTVTTPVNNRTITGGSTNQPLWFNDNYNGGAAFTVAPYVTSSNQGLMNVDVGFEWGTFSITAPSVKDKIYSYHSGNGCHVSFCDGHQQFLHCDMDVLSLYPPDDAVGQGLPAECVKRTLQTVLQCAGSVVAPSRCFRHSAYSPPGRSR